MRILIRRIAQNAGTGDDFAKRFDYFSWLKRGMLLYGVRDKSDFRAYLRFSSKTTVQEPLPDQLTS